MADKCQMLMRKKEEKQDEEVAELNKDVREIKNEKEITGTDGEISCDATTNNGVVANSKNGDFQVEPMEVPPFEIITGDWIDPLVFRFQFKNVEYSSGRNKTFLCYLVDKGNTADGIHRGYLEDEHTSSHAEEAFFMHCLPHSDPSLNYTVTWYVSSSPCSACATKIAEVLKARRNVKLNIFAARLFEWEIAEVQAGLRALHTAGCKLRVMKPLDFTYTWDTFVENEDLPLNLWEDCKENYEYYHGKLADILQ